MAQGHLPRLAALALATGTLMAVSTAPAAAAPTSDRIFEATGSGAVLRVEINLPAGLDGALPQRIVQDVVLADGAVRTGASATALGNAFLGQSGNVAPLQALLDGKAQSDLAKTTDAYSAVEVPANPLGLTGGALRATSQVADPNVDGVLSQSSSSVVSLELKASGALGALLAPVQAALQEALGATAAAPVAGGGSAVAPVTTTVTDLLGTALDAVDEVSSGATEQVSDEVQAAVDLVIAELNELLAELTDQVLSVSASDTLLDIGLVESGQKVTRDAGTVTSEVANKLVGVDVLGGLISVSGIESTALASLGDNGLSAAEANATLLKTVVGDLLTLEVANDLRTALGGSAGQVLPGEVVATVNDVLAQITVLLGDTLGLQTPVQAQTHESTSADAASATVEAASLVLDPLRNAQAPLLRIGFVPAEATVTARSVAAPVQLAAPANLPRTGGELPLTGALATLLVGAALVARRRRATV
jgi:hypothetical protein